MSSLHAEAKNLGWKADCPLNWPKSLMYNNRLYEFSEFGQIKGIIFEGIYLNASDEMLIIFTDRKN